MRKFQRTFEDFVCEKCGHAAKGDGYTDHCPVCLWSKHVDINPGDRQADCLGLMRPIGIEIKHNETRTVYVCEKCGHKHKVKKAESDNMDKILMLSGMKYEL